MKIAILGYDTEGKVSYDYFLRQGHDVVVHDENPALKLPAQTEAVLGDKYLDNLSQYDVIVRTPGLSPRKILKQSPEVADKITSGTNEFFKSSSSKNVIGVTGSKGKGTTSTLIAKMLDAAGKTVHLAGNIGVPALSLIGKTKPEDWIVLELSSFQLIDIKYSPAIGVSLMMVPEHLNWHADFEEYMTAKSRMFRYQTREDKAVFFADNQTSQDIAAEGAGQKIPYYAYPGAYVDEGRIIIDDQVICGTAELKLIGEHNWQNACAAVTAAWQVTQEVAAMRSVLTAFSGLEHRLEFVREAGGVKYYDDSFGTTPETAIVAIQAFNEPKIVILGGSDKGSTYDNLAEAVVVGNVKKVILIGDTGAAIREALAKKGYTDVVDGGSDMITIVARAKQYAQPGNVVLLSTGCASFGLFQNYKDRGEQFKRQVAKL